jgi:putative peptidoglycan lipid II flippase
MSSDQAPPKRAAGAAIQRSAVLVAAGILLSRLSGLVRTSLFAGAFGLKDTADVVAAALRIPNFLQNLFGEGALSASFIPVYSALLGAKRADEADRAARAILALLALVTSVIVLAGVLWTPLFIDLVAAGYTGAKRDLLIELVRIMFPGVGLLVLSAWCLAILNSHGRFFLSYAAPVVWNVAMIAVLVVFRHASAANLAIDFAWGAVAGSALQLAIQMPTVWRLMSGHWSDVRLHLSEHVRTVLKNFVPVLFSRGVVQISALIDGFIASFLGEGPLAALFAAQQLYTLPVSLFGMSVSAAELPAMSGTTGHATARAEALRGRLENSQRAIAVLVIPSALAFLAFGDVIAATLFQLRNFHHQDAVFVWAILAGSAVGLLASTLARLYAAAFYALGDTTTPVQYAVVRVILVAGLGYLLAIPLPHVLGLDLRWGTPGLTASAGVAGWVEFALLRRGLQRRIGAFSLQSSLLWRAWTAAGAAALVAVGGRWLIPITHPQIRGIVILGAYGLTYLAIAHQAKIVSFDEVVKRLKR